MIRRERKTIFTLSPKRMGNDNKAVTEALDNVRYISVHKCIHKPIIISFLKSLELQLSVQMFTTHSLKAGTQ